MIKVSINKDSDKRITSFLIQGHAQFAEPGEDIVCAGVSAVSIGSINAVEELLGIELSVEQRGGGGYLRCSVPNLEDKAMDEKLQLLIRSMISSLESIEREYHSYIKITYHTQEVE
ncbi:ribosomal-processing cysteine protease Prp [Bacillus litorisediminis]|uniref:ribosomal-processing cysteine protease Prp n=1 Tax=Bacillus litorisediminis TaxID=2922713 RepID=UPI001FAD7AA0|nr:ribosomal-processing cysteine protease Prp [Bacillus litorisediminis]